MKESPIERYLVAQVKKIGGKAIKLLPTYENGMPDRQVLYEGRSVFVELKATGKKPRALQVAFSKELAKVGFEVVVIDSKQGVDALVSGLKNPATFTYEMNLVSDADTSLCNHEYHLKGIVVEQPICKKCGELAS